MKVSADTATLAEEEYATPVGRHEKLAMIIWQIIFWVKCPTPEDGARTSIRGCLTTNPQDITDAADFDFFDEDVLAYYQVTNDDSTGTGLEYMAHKGLKHWNFEPKGVIVAKSKMYLQAMNNNDSDNVGFGCWIGYTVEKVSDADFLNALTE
jgi:hypothetical protein